MIVAGCRRIIRYRTNCTRKVSSRTRLKRSPNAKTVFVSSTNEEETVASRQPAEVNELGIPMIAAELHRRLFGQGSAENRGRETRVDDDSLKRIRYRIAKAAGVGKDELLGKSDSVAKDDANFDIPELRGDTVEEHFSIIAEEQLAVYRDLAKKLAAAKIPQMPSSDSWVMRPGWTKYTGNGANIPVDYPEDDALFFDVEVCAAGVRPTLAVAMSENAWYSWCSDDLCGGENSTRRIKLYFAGKGLFLGDLIPLESKGDQTEVTDKRKRLIVGHNVAFDRTYVKEQYYLKKTELRFLDTMSMHIATSGFASIQRNIHLKKKDGYNQATEAKHGESDSNGGQPGNKEVDWESRGSMNSLVAVHRHYCPSSSQILDKQMRDDLFIHGCLNDVRNKFAEAMDYCAKDVAATSEVFSKLLPDFLDRFPHPVTLGGMLEMGTAYLPINRTWSHFIEAAEESYNAELSKIKKLLVTLANESVSLLDGGRYKDDAWLWDEDWSLKRTELTESTDIYKKSVGKMAKMNEKDPTAFVERVWDTFRKNIRKEPLYMPMFPKWYRDLCSRPPNIPEAASDSSSAGSSFADTDGNWGPQKITLQMRIAPKLMRMHYDGYPLHYNSTYGWGYLVPTDRTDAVTGYEMESDGRYFVDLQSRKRVIFPLERIRQIVRENRQRLNSDNGTKKCDKVELLECGLPGVSFCRLPHKDGAGFNVGNPLAKELLHLIEKGQLMSQCRQHAKLVAEVNQTCSYWRITRDRIMSQLPVFFYQSDDAGSVMVNGDDPTYGAIIPRVVTAGAVTRRAVEPLWMTASNAKANRIGSEVKGLVQAPPGYVFVGADVDSQELWIASLLGDSWKYKIHGCTPFSWMLLRGDKANGTDQHSMVAAELGVTRDNAKVLNYGRIYGAGLPFAVVLLQQFLPGKDVTEIQNLARRLYFKTKGRRRRVCSLTPEGANVFFPHLEEEEAGVKAAQDPVDLLAAKQIFSDRSLQFDSQYCAKEWLEWVGGTYVTTDVLALLRGMKNIYRAYNRESEVFNRLERIALSDKAATPVLECRLSRALELGSEDKGFLPSRINWVVQSSGVDYLHLMLVCMRWLFDKYEIDGRFSISIHDEVRYLVAEKDKYRAALAMQITNLLTRAMFVSKMGMEGLPRSVAYFNKVDIDKALRKEVDLDCVTPSNPLGLRGCYRIPPGEALDIHQISLKTGGGRMDKP